MGLVDFIPEGDSPLTFDDTRTSARPDELHDVLVWTADLAHLVALKRLADRPRDRDDLERLGDAYGELPEIGDQ